jgi:hypothetical protein
MMKLLPCPTFKGYRDRSGSGDLSFFKPGDTAVLTVLEKSGRDYTETSQLITLTRIEPHNGQTINGLTVERAHEKDLTTFDHVDYVTYRTRLGRDQVQEGPEHKMLYGEYIPDQGEGKYGEIVLIHEADAQGNPYRFRTGEQKELPPAKIIKILPVHDYISWAVETRNRLTDSLNACPATFWGKLRNLFA